jgi:hypothetical protein
MDTIEGSFEVEALISSQERDSFYSSAVIIEEYWGPSFEDVFQADAEIIEEPEPSFFGYFVVDAWVIGTAGLFVADAQISAPVTIPGAVFADSVVSASYRLTNVQAHWITKTTEEDQFLANALIDQANFTADACVAPWGWFTADGFILPQFTADAEIWTGSQFTADAIFLVPIEEQDAFAADADISAEYEARGSFTWDATILWDEAYNDYWFSVDAEIAEAVWPFTADAFVQPYFTADAFIRQPFFSRTWFSANAYIYDPRWFTANAYLYKPNVHNPPPVEPPSGDPNPPPTPPPPAGPPVSMGHHVRILIKYNGVMTEITQDVVWNETEFTQQAKTAPGQFRVTLRGNFTQYDGGEDIYLEIDGYRQFGGLVTMVQFDYWYADVALAKTVLLGSDYNIYLDRIIVWNKPDNPAGSGMFVPFRGFRSELSDRSIIRYVCTYLINAPTGFDGITYVGLIDSNLMDGDKYFIKEGMTLREFMSEVSQVTNGIWWMDQFLNLHYVSRSVLSAPAIITDGPTGVSCRNLEWRSDTSSMANDAYVWGTLATTVAGKVVVSHNYNAAAIAKYGLRQYSEVRADLHETDHIQKRASSIRFRRGIAIETASLDLFEAGFAAGQVVSLAMSSYGKTKEFVIRSVQSKFLNMSSADGTIYHGMPIYHLELGLDPEDPWNFYDMLPFDIPPWDVPSGFVMPLWDIHVTGGFLDTFHRADHWGWGTSDSGHVWYDTIDGCVWPYMDYTKEISSNRGVFTSIYNTAATSEYVLPASGTLRATIHIDSDTGGFDAIDVSFGNIPVGISRYADGSVIIYAVKELYITPPDWSAYEDFYVKIQWDPNGISAYSENWGRIDEFKTLAKFWPVGQPEPTYWQVGTTYYISQPEDPLVIYVYASQPV